MSEAERRIQSYFRSKSQRLLAEAEEVVTEHSGLRGSHRENVIRIYLSDILPRRYVTGSGMVYGLAHRSREADIVIWDAQNYPSMQMQGHALFFAESTRAVLEVKSQWNSETRNDILAKCRAVRDIVTVKRPNMADDLAMLQLEVASLLHGEEHSGMVIAGHHIATGAIALFGGQTFSLDAFDDQTLRDVDDAWPDLLLLLNQGKVVLKHYSQDEGSFSGHGWLELVEAGEDALLVFSAALLGLITERSVHVEDPFYLAHYAQGIIESLPSSKVHFPLTRPAPGRTPLWHRTPSFEDG